MKFDPDSFWTFTLRDLIWCGVVLSTIVWSLAVMPQRLAADLTLRFASREQVDSMREDISYMRGRIDRIYENMGLKQ